MADLVVTAANVAAAAGSKIRIGTAGAAITAGDSLYADAADGKKLKPAQHDVNDDQARCVGIALNAADDDQPVNYVSGGNINLGATLVVGETYAVGAAAGGIAPFTDVGSGDFMSVLGIADSASNLQLKIFNSGVARA